MGVSLANDRGMAYGLHRGGISNVWGAVATMVWEALSVTGFIID